MPDLQDRIRAIIDEATPVAADEAMSLQDRRGPSRSTRGISWRPALVGAVVVMALALTTIWIIGRSSTREEPLGPPQPPVSSTQAPVTTQPLCADVPQLRVPDGFSAPVDRAVSDAPEPASDGQSVRTSSSGPTDIEVRTPIDSGSAARLPQSFGGGSGGVGFGPYEIRTTADGRFYNDMLFKDFNRPEGCNTTQLRVFSSNSDTVALVFGELSRQPFESGVPLVTSHVQAAVAPTAIACPATGEKSSDIIDGGVYATPEQALEATVDILRTLPTSGYVSHDLPDGSVAFGNKVFGDEWIVVIHVVPVGEQWTIDRMDASAC